MKSRLFISIALLVTVCGSLARDITTLKGRTYHDVIARRVETNGITITSKEGEAFLNFADLPPELRAEFVQLEAVPGATQPAPGPIQPSPNAVSPTPTAIPPAVDTSQPLPEVTRVAEITTLDGNVYRDVTITRIEPTGFRITHRNGIGFIDYLTLPVSVRRRYGYSERAYTAGSAQKRQRDAAAAESQRRFAAAAATREADAHRQRAEAQAAAARFAAERAEAALRAYEASIATRNYSTTDYSSRDYSTERYSGGGYSGGPVHVSGYTRKDGTYVRPYTRRR